MANAVKERYPFMTKSPLTYDEIYRNLDGIVALAVAESTDMRKRKGERDTEFVKRIVATYAVIAQARS